MVLLTPIGLAREGIAVLSFDIMGFGSSKGEFAPTNFSSMSPTSFRPSTI